jgi:DNA-binding transcriptional MerR regulator
MTVHELARRAGIPSHVVRYYTQRGLLSPQRHARNRYRLYAETDFDRLRFICRAKTIGFSLSEIDAILRDVDGGAASRQVREIVQLRAAEHAERVATAERLQHRISDALRAWSQSSDETPDHQSLCRFIDAVVLGDEAAGAAEVPARGRRSDAPLSLDD